MGKRELGRGERERRRKEGKGGGERKRGMVEERVHRKRWVEDSILLASTYIGVLSFSDYFAKTKLLEDRKTVIMSNKKKENQKAPNKPNPKVTENCAYYFRCNIMQLFFSGHGERRS